MTREADVAGLVTQEDRDAAWPFRPACYRDDPNPGVQDRWDAGQYDHCGVIRAFARHRIAALEDAASLADSLAHGLEITERDGKGWPTTPEGAAKHQSHAIATAIRALSHAAPTAEPDHIGGAFVPGPDAPEHFMSVWEVDTPLTGREE